MSKKLAIKKLTASDLTFFEYHYRNNPAGKQKAINLNADVFIEKMYPFLETVAENNRNRIPITLEFYGPGIRYNVYSLTRKIIKGENYKNWRLDGELIHEQDDAPDRFKSLIPGDFAVMEFDGSETYPNLCKIILIGLNFPDDVGLHGHFQNFMVEKSMKLLSISELEEIVAQIKPEINPQHPIFELILDEAIEDAAQGGIQGIKILARRPSYSTVRDPDALERAWQKAAKIGRKGEELVDVYLTKQKTNSIISDYEWASRDNAVSPYDFIIWDKDNIKVLIDVKTTEYDFEQALHISFNELLTMRDHNGKYDLFRVYNVTENSGNLRIASDLKKFSEKILEILEQLPKGVTSDSISVKPRIISFGNEVSLSIQNTNDTQYFNENE